ncbi:MAG: FtsX-like permease family protein [Spirochaetes bacterium]|nr:FtsX-like permease family protein [Spirochaetota bacterium]
MPVTLRLAFRNLFEHRSKSLIIGILLAVGTFILVLGNSFIDASKQSIREAFTENYTGDVFVSGVSAEGEVSLFGVTSVGGLAATPTIPDYDKILSGIQANPLVDKATGMATGYGIVTKNGEGLSMEGEGKESDSFDPASRFLFMFGIDPQSYWKVFDTITITSGKAIGPGESGLIINETHLAKIAKWQKKPLAVGDSLVIQGISSAGMKLREMKILGTYKQKGEGAAPEQMAFVDIDTLRVMAGMTIGTNEAITLSPQQTSMLQAKDTDSLFGDDLFEAAPAKGGFNEAALSAQLADTKARELANTADTGAWQFIVVKTKNRNLSAQLVKSLNADYQAKDIAVKAGDWQKAAGPYGQSVDVIRIVFTIAIVILSIVAIIIIMNTFVISVIERTGEIGTMRAIGAEKGFIRKLFAAEAVVLSLVFSTVGAALALATVAILNAARIPTGNPFLAILLGGKYLSPFATPQNVLFSILGMVLVGWLAHLYPVSVALRIEPVEAMRND